MSNEILVTNDEVEVMSSLDVMKYLDDVQRSRYAAFQETFESSGWPLVVEWAQLKALEAEKAAARAGSLDELRAMQGVRETWEQVQGMATMFMNEFENVAMQNKIDAEVESEDDFGVGDESEET